MYAFKSSRDGTPPAVPRHLPEPVLEDFSGFLFFFSSRRRHTRWTGDWSSDVCSSDLRRAADSSSSSCCRPVKLMPREHLRYRAINFTGRQHELEELSAALRAARAQGAALSLVSLKEIGRASCREREESSVGAGSLKKK